VNILNRLYRAITGSPIVWGVLGSAAFYGLIHGGVLTSPLIHRYFTHHPVEYGEVVLFAIGMAALVLRMLDVAGQRMMLKRSSLATAAGRSDQPIDERCRSLLEHLDRTAASRCEEYFVRRLRSAIRYVQRLGSAEGLGDELKFLADADVTRAHGRYGLFRVIVWSIPILGFLGTVIGITLALNAIDPQHPDESMLDVIKGLGLKFDTTAVALSLSMVLMFTHFFADRAETSLLEEVDERTEDELAGLFPQMPGGADGQVVAMRRMAESLVGASERLVERQAELWQASMDAAAQRWVQMADAAAGHLTKTLTGSLAEGLKSHAQQLAAAEQSAAEQGRRQLEKVVQPLAQSVESLAAIQAELARQSDVLQRAVQATGDVIRLEDALNRNLATLAGAKHFEQTVLGLAATINLLNARLSESSAASPIHLESNRRTNKAA
jgi:biopolymer transport protein ExbB/TolQ